MSADLGLMPVNYVALPVDDQKGNNKMDLLLLRNACERK